MQYKADITVSANTSRVDAKETKIKVSGGVIHRFVIVFPSGCNALVGVQIFEGGHPISPSTDGQFWKGDNRIIDFPDFVEIKGAPRVITVKSFNEDTKFDHTIIVELYQLPAFIVSPFAGVNKFVKLVTQIFQRKKQEEI